MVTSGTVAQTFITPKQFAYTSMYTENYTLYSKHGTLTVVVCPLTFSFITIKTVIHLNPERPNPYFNSSTYFCLQKNRKTNIISSILI